MRRTKAVLVLLCRNDGFLNAKDLAKALNVSLKTIYNCLNEIDDFMTVHKYPLLIRNKKQGVKLDLNHSSINEMMNAYLINKDDYLTSDERSALEIIELILHDKPMSIHMLSIKLMVSRGSVLNDLAGVKSSLENTGCQLESIPYKGIMISGNESSKRRIVVDCLYKHRIVSQRFIERIGKGFDLIKIESILNQFERELEIKFTDDSYHYLQLYLIVANYRQSNQFFLLDEDLDKESQRVFSKEYEISHKIVQLQKIQTRLEWSESEVLFLTQTIMSLKYYKTNENMILNDQWFIFQTLTNQFLVSMEQELHLNLLNDKELFDNLLIHIRSSCYRLMYGIHLTNPLSMMIKDKYNDLFFMIKKHVRIFETKINVEFNDDEISYLVLYIASMVERRKLENKTRQKVIAIICDSGLSTSWIIKKQIETKYLVIVEGIYSMREVDLISKNENIDFIITTLPVLKTRKPYLVVNPILNELDYELLDKNLEGTSYKDHRIHVLIETCQKYVREDYRKEFKDEIYRIFAIEQNSHQKKEGNYPMLMELISEDLIKAKVKVKNRSEAIESGGQLLFDKGFIELKYIEAMHKNVEDNGPYIVIAPGIAIPHARPECGVNKIGFSIITLEDSVVFGHPLNDPVKIVICLCAIDHQTHLIALSELIDILGNAQKLEAILNAQTAKEIMGIIASKAKGEKND